MDFGNTLILVCTGLILLSIFAGLVSSRLGAPLLLVFLALGMLAGQDGPGGIQFDDFQAAYVIGAASLAIVLFDGGLHTSLDTLKSASWPALILATVGVVITAAITGAGAHWLFGLDWLESLLVGSIVSSTDAAAVFFLLNLHGTNLAKRPRVTLEAESGLNDPMAVFLTVTLVELLKSPVDGFSWALAGAFAATFTLQLAGGALAGIVGGYALVEMINRLKLPAGLYPILALAWALLIFAAAQLVGASGFLAAYLCGIVVGNRRHRARQLIDRFQDGIAWLSQIVMFVMLGLLVAPWRLLIDLLPALGIALVLIVAARPIAVVLCILPFRYNWREHAFLSWVGLRGAVPIFLGTIPVLTDVPHARLYFDIAFVAVLASLLIQGWTVNLAARLFSIALPPGFGAPQRFDIDLPEDVGRDMAVFTIHPDSAATRRPPKTLAVGLGPGAEVVAVVHQGEALRPNRVERLAGGDQVIVLAPEERMADLDELFGAPPPADRRGLVGGVFGEFSFDATITIGALADAYDFPVSDSERALSIREFLDAHFRNAPEIGDRLRLGPIELIVQTVKDRQVMRVGIELDPAGAAPLSLDKLRGWARRAVDLRRLRRFFRGTS